MSIERDSLDATATHVLAETDGVPVGTGRLISRGDLGVVGRMAVVESARRTSKPGSSTSR